MNDIFDNHAMYVLRARKTELEASLRGIEATLEEQNLVKIEKTAKLNALNKAIEKLS
jgi:hypothetical protein